MKKEKTPAKLTHKTKPRLKGLGNRQCKSQTSETRTMREIKYIVIHCTATPQNTTIESILKYWKTKWKKPGYHYIITPEGEIRNLLSIKEISNGVKGYNENSIHIAYIGGIDANGKELDNRTKIQKKWMYQIIKTLKEEFPEAEIKGHRDFENVNKTCPSFNVKQWVECTGL